MTETPQEILNRLFQVRTCVLATSTLAGKPQTAYMYFVSDDKNNLYFKTFNDNRKYKNIKPNPKASVVIYEKPDYVQMDGLIEEVLGSEAEIAKRKLISKYGEDQEYQDKRLRFLMFKPTWIRVRINNKYPYKFEVLK